MEEKDADKTSKFGSQNLKQYTIQKIAVSKQDCIFSDWNDGYAYSADMFGTEERTVVEHRRLSSCGQWRGGTCSHKIVAQHVPPPRQRSVDV